MIFLVQVFLSAISCAGHLDLGDPGCADIVVEHKGYAVGYSRRHCQAKWTQYRLTKENIKSSMGKPRYGGGFERDPDIPYMQAWLHDYRKSGYHQGHMVPDLDLRYSAEAEKETFYYSNVSPQIGEFNNGVWKRLENKVRSLAIREGSIVIVTGPVFSMGGERKLGDRITVPEKFFKVIYSEGEKPKMIGFIIPHRSTQSNIKDFVCTVSKVETETGLRFFTKLPPRLLRDLKTLSSPSEWGM
jgi:endonuclease G